MTVGIVAAASRGAATEIGYRVHNGGTHPVWLVDDGWLVYRQEGERIELSFARARLRDGVAVFGYFPPAVVRLDPGEAVQRQARLVWPVALSALWNADRLAAPAPGAYRVAIEVGYGTAPQPDDPAPGERIDAAVGRWQRLAASPPLTVRIPPYAAAKA